MVGMTDWTLAVANDGAYTQHTTALHSGSNAALLDFSNAYHGDDKCEEIIEAVRRAAYPVQLDLRGNRFTATGAKRLAEMIKTYPVIVSLCLEWNNVGLLDEGVEALALALEMDTKLVELDLQNNNVGPEGAKALAQALRRNRTLQKLDLRWNEVGNAGVLAFLDTMQSNRSLVALELAGNNSSFKHLEEIERLLARNRSIQGQPREMNNPLVETVTSGSPEKPTAMQDSGRNDQLLLQVLAEKDNLETDLNVAKRHSAKLNEKVEECEMQMQLLRRELESLKEGRDRYQQREIDAKADAHDAKMRFEELENRRKMEFEEYRSARMALERECNVLREKLSHAESLHHKSDDQKTKQVTHLEEIKYKLESEVHRLTLAMSSQEEEQQRVKKELQDAVTEHARVQEKLRRSHESEVSTLTRQHEHVLGTLQTQLRVSMEHLEETKQSMASLKDKHDALQAALLQSKVTHEKELTDLKKQYETELQDRMQRSMAAIEAQVEEVKKSRVHLEREVEKHLSTIVQLRQENISLQQTHTERQETLQAELDRQYKELQEKQDQVSTAQREITKANEQTHRHARRVEEQEAAMTRLKETYEARLKDAMESAETAAIEFRTAITTKTELVHQLETQLVQLERALTKLNEDHELRLDHLAQSFTSYIQEQMLHERDRRQQQRQKPS
ncbi:hypothetical protein Poli38472_000553 [Pythium oligandrum]|uniref:Uncharacterized protein n=1 Tax=Pythium oligandrum TaxID=41045 RepID=A0A8K1FFG0_PYTOL|nr:hypothetical protein Poli38472_000553 [Pythium oligandrum]|eukprot:TMW60511.1 hypothetical protein Poli38472_000553 [Pythium oligandrum]